MFSVQSLIILAVLSYTSMAQLVSSCHDITCPSGTYCKVEGDTAKCFKPLKCNKNEIFRDCASHAEPSCDNRNAFSILASCAPPACQCIEGFYRNRLGQCVSAKECEREAKTAAIRSKRSITCANVRCAGVPCHDTPEGPVCGKSDKN